MTQATDRYTKHPRRFSTGNRAIVLRDGTETYPAMLAALASAQQSICVETYILASDSTGWKFAEVLIARSKAGVEVNLLIDAFGSLTCSQNLLGALRQAGVRIAEYHPIAPWRPRWGWTARDHRKITIVDGELGFIGGVNISSENEPLQNGGGGWRDTHCQVEGPVVRDLARLFLEMWRRAGGPQLDHRKYLLSSHEKGTARATVLDTSVFRNRSAIRKAYLHALRQAVHSICITNAYFLPDSGILHAIRDARKRGVEVAVMLPAASDVMMVRYASRALYPRLLRWGVEIYEFQSHMLHAKTAVIDGIWSTVGSCNLDHRSFRLNQEANLVFLDEEIGKNLLKMFQDDKTHCVKIDIGTFEKRSIIERAIEHACYFFRTWL